MKSPASWRLLSISAVHCPYVSGGRRLGQHQTARSPAGQDQQDRAATALGTDRSSFLLAQGRLAAQRVLADRDFFLLDADAQQEWERINSRPARSLPGLERLLERPSPFV